MKSSFLRVGGENEVRRASDKSLPHLQGEWLNICFAFEPVRSLMAFVNASDVVSGGFLRLNSQPHYN